MLLPRKRYKERVIEREGEKKKERERKRGREERKIRERERKYRKNVKIVKRKNMMKFKKKINVPQLCSRPSCLKCCL